MGRTTELTTGVYNGCDIDVNITLPPDDRTKQRKLVDSEGAELEDLFEDKSGTVASTALSRMRTREQCILKPRRENEGPFSGEGDTGAWVFDGFGTLMGMVLGQNGRAGATIQVFGS